MSIKDSRQRKIEVPAPDLHTSLGTLNTQVQTSQNCATADSEQVYPHNETDLDPLHEETTYEDPIETQVHSSALDTTPANTHSQELPTQYCPTNPPT